MAEIAPVWSGGRDAALPRFQRHGYTRPRAPLDAHGIFVAKLTPEEVCSA